MAKMPTTVLMLLLLFLTGCGASDEYVELGTASNCDVARTQCRVDHGDAEVALSLGKNVVPLQPFDAVVTITGVSVDPETVIADFQMKGMDMGVNRYRMLAGAGQWSGRVTLPVCTASRMDWIALVEFTSGEGTHYRARFTFETAKP